MNSHEKDGERNMESKNHWNDNSETKNVTELDGTKVILVIKRQKPGWTVFTLQCSVGAVNWFFS